MLSEALESFVILGNVTRNCIVYRAIETVRIPDDLIVESDCFSMKRSLFEQL